MTALHARSDARVEAVAAPTGKRSPTGTTLLRAEGLRVERGAAAILRSVDLELRAGELTAVVGPNGAGKSTLLHVLAGDLRADGTVELSGRPLAAWPVGALARQRAVLPQEAPIAFPFRVEEVVRMGRAPWARQPERDRDDAIVAWAMAVTDVTDLAARSVASLSGGERARVLLARVLAQDTPLLLLDEPAAALDLPYEHQVLQLLHTRARAGDAVLVVLHDLTAAAAHADRVVLLGAGAVVASGAPEDVLTAELLSATYGSIVDVISHPRTGAPIVLPGTAPQELG